MNTKARGFTLTELLVVVGIAMLVMAMGAVGFRGALKNQRLKGAASELQAAIIQSRGLAVAQNAMYYGYLEPAEGTYGCYSESGGPDTVGQELQGKLVYLPSTITLNLPNSTARPEITFRSDGTISWNWTTEAGGDRTRVQAGNGSGDMKITEKNGGSAHFDLTQNTGAVWFDVTD
jgi:Tfp pilus assembly protein FimT